MIRAGAVPRAGAALDRQLDEGGMATVYLADDLKHERKVAQGAEARARSASGKYFRLQRKATLTSPSKTGTSTNGPMTAANAAPCAIPNVPTATAIASSKLLEAAVNERVAVLR